MNGRHVNAALSMFLTAVAFLGSTNMDVALAIHTSPKPVSRSLKSASARVRSRAGSFISTQRSTIDFSTNTTSMPSTLSCAAAP